MVSVQVKLIIRSSFNRYLFYFPCCLRYSRIVLRKEKFEGWGQILLLRGILLALVMKAASEQGCQHAQIPIALKWLLFGLSGTFIVVTSNSQPKLKAEEIIRDERAAPGSKMNVEQAPEYVSAGAAWKHT